ncbi:hypothetical protein B0H13DRAFT_1510589, partial [Mycena leptocephala]
GKKMLDLEARSEAIQMLRLKSYLNLNLESRAGWGRVADKEIQRYDKKTSSVDDLSFVNMYLQRWAPNLEKLPNGRQLPKALREMISVGHKYGVTFDTINPSAELNSLLPLFHHFREDRNKTQYNNEPQSKCLRQIHKVR